MIQTVLFDVGNVILRASHAITFAILGDLGVRPDRAVLFYQQSAYGEFSRGRITSAEFAQAVREALEAPWLTDVQIRTAHDAHIYMVDEVIVEVVVALKRKEQLLGFVTNTNEWQTAREPQLINLAGRFGPVVRSHEIGMLKTDSCVWPVILERLCVPIERASSILLVDDSPANNADAEAAGLVTHQYNPSPLIGIETLKRTLVEHGLFP